MSKTLKKPLITSAFPVNDYVATDKMLNLHDNITKAGLEGKIVFWDIDGTLAPYRFNGHVGDPCGTNNGQSIEEVNAGIFYKRKPSKFMQRVVADCNAKQHIIMGHCQATKEMDDKHKWLDWHYPMIKERLLVPGSHSKADAIISYCEQHNIDLLKVVYVDDVIPFLREAEKKGINAWHISSFMDYFEQ